MTRSWFYILLLCISATSCDNGKTTLFKKIPSSKTNIQFANTLNVKPELNILNYLYYYNGGGIASADFNNDGLIDLYFTGNQVADELYLNKGDFQFENITTVAGIENPDGWTTGVTSIDINSDGLLDIYVCKVGNYQNLSGHNLLYVNQGVNSDGIPSFKEEAAKYNLDFSGFSTHAAFFDYDLDGDLDLYLMNHSVYPNRAYGRGAQRKNVDSLSGDRIYQNNGASFDDVSESTGIFQGKSGYGLGLSISDLNNDGFPDIYVGNDFFENDYLYINQKDGTFKEIISTDDKNLGHTTHFSMGNDVADINNDGLTDIISLDMLPENLQTYKTSGLEYSYPIYQQYLKNGYAPQYMQNTLHLNLNNGNFAEIGSLSGIAATEWSWGTLLADFDNDGLKDVFISNGIKGATNDMDFINFISNEGIQKRLSQGMLESDMPLIDEIPVKRIPNYIYKNTDGTSFVDKTDSWIGNESSFSNGSIYADLDNDGDLDIVVNNVDELAFIMENTSTSGNHLSLTINAGPKNKFGIGTKVTAYTPTKTITQENYISKGYLSAVDPSLHLGLGTDSIIDSLQIIWPDGKYQMLYDLKASASLALEKDTTKLKKYHYTKQEKEHAFVRLDSLVDFQHSETASLDFDREPLIPFANSNQGPDITVFDANKDGLEDFFISGAKRQSSVLYIQETDGNFIACQPELFDQDKANEDVTHTVFNANDDAYPDLLVGSGGNEFLSGKPIQPRIYLNRNGQMEIDTLLLPKLEVNASKVMAVDFNNDNVQEILLLSDQVPSQYGKTPRQYLLKRNSQGKFIDATEQTIPELVELGNIKDALSVDIDNNGFMDLIVAGHWVPIAVFLNDGQTLTLQKNNGLENTHGWWNTIQMDDLDGDGDLDLIAGNWGLNSKLKATTNQPINLYLNDFDDNGSMEPIVTYFHKNTETPFASKDELVKQMPFLNKKYLSYATFAKASITELFGSEKLNSATTKHVYELASCYFINEGNGTFTKHLLPNLVQSSAVFEIGLEDLDNDNVKELIFLGNNFEISTQLGRLDAFHGLILQRTANGGYEVMKNTGFDVSGAARSMKKITVDDKAVFIVGRNNAAPKFLVKRQQR